MLVHHRTSPAFSLLEVAVVIVIVGILAVGVIPALGSTTGARQAACAREVHRLLTHARTFAMTTGQPSGVIADASSSTLTSVYIPTGSMSVAPLRTSTGATVDPLVLSSSFPNVEILSCVGGDGSTGLIRLWFSHSGIPQTRDAGGTLTGSFTQDASISLTGGFTISVRRVSGLVER
ncbi:MAG: prepilin-type N-terminal cleavage/methylation domain-containing protein [Phycisphaeraceae bacterium]|nr:prepilin-type N-terminal cleavage/methylation domain-containing protein [Phycisphaeraceae bacterium]